MNGKENILQAACFLALIIFLVLFINLNVPIQNGTILHGKVTHIGLDTSTIHTLPKQILTIKLDSNTIITLPHSIHTPVSIGQRVNIKQSQTLLSQGIHYTRLEIID